MISRLLRFRRQILTLLVAGGALLSGYLLWHEDRISPWTRDGRVRADSVVVAPDVSGLVVSVDVRDNQEVQKGEILFRLDPRRFSLALSARFSSRAPEVARLLLEAEILLPSLGGTTPSDSARRGGR